MVRDGGGGGVRPMVDKMIRRLCHIMCGSWVYSAVLGYG